MTGKKRMWLIALIVIILGVVIGIVLSRQKEPMKRRPSQTKQKPIKILTVKNSDIKTAVEMSGPLYAYNKVELYAEVSGVLQETSRPFKEGYQYKKGDVLIRVDDSVYKHNLLAQKSNLVNQLTLLLPDLSIDFPQSTQKWEAYLKNLKLENPLPELPGPASDKERYYIVSRNIYNLFYTIKSMEATFAKYTLKAPFAGVVTQSQINPGTLVRVGQKLGEFTSTDLYEMEAAVGLFEANRLNVGQAVTLKTEDVRGTFPGKIQRINRVIDRSSMTVKVYIHTRDTRLRDGMYMQAYTEGKPITDAYSVAKDLLLEQNRLYVVEDTLLKLRQVDIIGEKGGRVIIRGLADGTRILGEVWSEAKEGKQLPASESGQSLQNGQVADPNGPGAGADNNEQGK
jgi:multidrug efflux pump subunit AcrA (membrane-fusion protein)